MATRSKQGGTQTSGGAPEDALTAKFEKGVQQLYRSQWPVAEKTFASIIETAGGSPLAARSRTLREVCRRRQEEPSDDTDDVFLSAVFAKNEGNLDSAMELCNRGGLKGKDHRFAYLAATIEQLRGNHEEAARLLERAIEMEPTNRIRAHHDPDLVDLREDPSPRDPSDPSP